TLDSLHSITSIMITPGAKRHVARNLSKIRPETGDKRPLIAPPGIRIRPAVNAESPSPICRYKGSKIIEDRIIIKVIEALNNASVYTGYFKTRKSSMGLSSLNCRAENTSKDNKPS